jgi:uncharacterized protein (DUF58 family)
MMPRLRMGVLFALAGVLLAIPLVFPFFVTIGESTAEALRAIALFLNAAVWIAAAIDLIISPSLSRIEIEREASDVMSIAARNPVKVWFTNRNRLPVHLEFHDEPPAPCTWAGLPFLIHLPPQRMRYRVYHIEPTEDRKLPRDVRIYPDIKAVHGIELLARRNRLAETGLKMSRLRGRGNEFDRLREYRREDEYRDIDWKATARHQELISREYVVERNQNILFVLDCGRSMCNELGGVTHLDRGLNAAIALSYVALRQGDNVGFLAFSSRVERWVRPMRGAGSIQTLIRHTYDLEPRYEVSDYSLMVEELRRRFRKRSLVIVATYALDELHLKTIGRALRELKQPHLVLGAFLRNVPLNSRIESVPETDVQAFQVAAAAEMVAAQTLQVMELERSGLLMVDALPENLSADLISRYLDVKARHLL